MQEQRELNNNILDELKTYQSILEYGRVLLDKDKEIRDKYKWIVLIKNKAVLPASIIIELISAIITYIIPTTSLFNVTILGGLILVCILSIRYVFRKDINRLINKKDKEKIRKHLDAVNDYLFKLDKWIKALSPKYKRSSDYIQAIKIDLQIEKKEIKSIENELSELYGKIDPELEKIAQEHATERLLQYLDYIYEKES